VHQPGKASILYLKVDDRHIREVSEDFVVVQIDILTMVITAENRVSVGPFDRI
jgi:polyribonucleotide nucleotidyltransferase